MFWDHLFETGRDDLREGLGRLLALCARARRLARANRSGPSGSPCWVPDTERRVLKTVPMSALVVWRAPWGR